MTEQISVLTQDATHAAEPAAQTETVQLTPVKARHKLLIPIDTQVDFVMRYGKLAVAGAERIILPSIEILTELDHEVYAGVLFTFDTHDPEEYMGSAENLGDPVTGTPGFPLHCAKGTPGWENVLNAQLVDQRIPIYQLEKDVFDMWAKDGDDTLVYQMPRNRPGGMFSSVGRNRESFFDHIVPHVDTATVIGVASDFCVKDAIRGLLARGLAVEVIADATAGIMRDIAQTVAEEFPGRVTVI